VHGNFLSHSAWLTRKTARIRAWLKPATPCLALGAEPPTPGAAHGVGGSSLLRHPTRPRSPQRPKIGAAAVGGQAGTRPDAGGPPRRPRSPSAGTSRVSPTSSGCAWRPGGWTTWPTPCSARPRHWPAAVEPVCCQAEVGATEEAGEQGRGEVSTAKWSSSLTTWTT